MTLATAQGTRSMHIRQLRLRERESAFGPGQRAQGKETDARSDSNGLNRTKIWNGSQTPVPWPVPHGSLVSSPAWASGGGQQKLLSRVLPLLGAQGRIPQGPALQETPPPRAALEITSPGRNRLASKAIPRGRPPEHARFRGHAPARLSQQHPRPAARTPRKPEAFVRPTPASPAQGYDPPPSPPH